MASQFPQSPARAPQALPSLPESLSQYLHALPPPPTINPFVNLKPFPSLYEYVKLVVLLPTLGMIRLILISLIVVLGALICYLATIGWEEFESGEISMETAVVRSEEDGTTKEEDTEREREAMDSAHLAHHHKPLSGWRRVLVWGYARAGARLILFLLGFYWIPVRGRGSEVCTDVL